MRLSGLDPLYAGRLLIDPVQGQRDLVHEIELILDRRKLEGMLHNILNGLHRSINNAQPPRQE